MSHRNSKIKMRHLTIAHMPMNITVVIGQVSPDCRLSQEPDGIGDADQQIVHSLSLSSQLPDIKKSSHILLSQIASMCRGCRDGLD